MMSQSRLQPLFAFASSLPLQNSSGWLIAPHTLMSRGDRVGVLGATEVVAEIQFMEWTGAETSASYCTSS